MLSSQFLDNNYDAVSKALFLCLKADQLRRYDDIIDFAEALDIPFGISCSKFPADVQSQISKLKVLVATAYKNKVLKVRSSLRSLRMHTTNQQYMSQFQPLSYYCKDQTFELKKNLVQECENALHIFSHELLVEPPIFLTSPKISEQFINGQSSSSKNYSCNNDDIFCIKLKADIYRYLAECQAQMEEEISIKYGTNACEKIRKERTDTTSMAEELYNKVINMIRELKNPIESQPLYFCAILNLCVLKYTLQGLREKAILTLKQLLLEISINPSELSFSMNSIITLIKDTLHQWEEEQRSYYL